ncbi:MAG: thioredoxin domain-containing protein [Nannocystaceae bacterium]
MPHAQDKTGYVDLDSPEAVDEAMTRTDAPIVLDFWSPNCGPCMAMADDFAAVALQFEANEVGFYKINTGTHGHLAVPFSIRSVPTIVFAHRGQVLDAVVGKMSARQLGEKTEWLVRKTSGKGIWKRLFN